MPRSSTREPESTPTLEDRMGGALGFVDGRPNVVTADYDDGRGVMHMDAEPRTLYVRRDLLNAREVLAHFRGQMSVELEDPKELHVTIAYSRTPVDWAKIPSDWDGGDADQGRLRVKPGGMRMMERLGPEGAKHAIVMQFTSTPLAIRWSDLKDAGCSWDFDDYQCHVTIAYDTENRVSDEDLRAMEPWRGELVFGPEIFEEVQ